MDKRSKEGIEKAVRSEVFSKGESDRIQFTKNNRFDMDLVLREFVEYFNDIYGDESYQLKLKPFV